MLKALIVIGLVAIGLFLLACVALAVIMLMIIVTTKPDPDGDIPAVRRRTTDVAPTHDEPLFSRVASEAMAYATRPYVTTIVDVSGVFLLTTVSDAFGRRVYAESRRRVSKTIVAVLCVYEGGASVPAIAVMAEFPASRADWSAYFAELKDIQAEGPRMSFTDHLGRRREIRIPRKRSHHA